jgi:hypothetical protein
VALMPAEGRLFLVAVFRRYHEEKRKGKEGGEIGGVRLPDPGNIGEVIAFQKRMYELFRHLIPPQPTILPPLFYPSSSPPSFNPITLYPPERSHPRFDTDFPPLPFLPFSHRPSVDSLRKSDSQFDRQSFFSRVHPPPSRTAIWRCSGCRRRRRSRNVSLGGLRPSGKNREVSSRLKDSNWMRMSTSPLKM